MKARVLLMGALSLATIASGQITLDQNNVPHSTTHSDIRARNSTGITIPTHGTNVLYDYTSLSNADRDTIPYLPATRTGFTSFTRFNYGFTTLNVFQLYSEYYTHKFTDGVARVGGYKLPETFNISTITGGSNDELIFPGNNSIFANAGYDVKFPSTYSTTWTSDYRFETDFELTVAAFGLSNTPGQQRQYVSQTDSVVGWGQLRLPTLGGVSILYDVLLMKRTYSYTDSIFLGGNPAPPALLTAFGLSQGQTSVSNSYSFYAEGFERPLLIIDMSANWQAANRSFHTAHGLATVGLEDFGALNAGKVYPNPAAAGGTVLFEAGQNTANTDLWVFDIRGQLLHREGLQNNGSLNMQWTIPANFDSGMYLFQLWNNGQCKHGKLIVE